MTAGVITIVVIAAAVRLVGLATGVRMVQQYERGIVFRFGRVLDVPASPRRPR